MKCGQAEGVYTQENSLSSLTRYPPTSPAQCIFYHGGPADASLLKDPEEEWLEGEG